VYWPFYYLFACAKTGALTGRTIAAMQKVYSIWSVHASVNWHFCQFCKTCKAYWQNGVSLLRVRARNKNFLTYKTTAN
jgi:hypothetical protein